MVLSPAMKCNLVLVTMALIVSQSQARFHPLKTEPCGDKPAYTFSVSSCPRPADYFKGYVFDARKHFTLGIRAVTPRIKINRAVVLFVTGEDPKVVSVLGRRAWQFGRRFVRVPLVLDFAPKNETGELQVVVYEDKKGIKACRKTNAIVATRW